MATRLILSCESESALFSERSLSLAPGEKIALGRSGDRKQAAIDNALFECKVLSRNHAVFSHQNGTLFLKDVGSRNGTFINGHRLSKANQQSEDVQLYSQDILRLGNQASEGEIPEKCLIVKLKIVLPTGAELACRPSEDRFTAKSVNKKEKRQQEHVNNSALDGRVQSLEEALSTVKGREEKILTEIQGLKETISLKEEQTKKLAEDHAQTKAKQDETILSVQNKLNITEEKLQMVLQEKNNLQSELDEQTACLNKKIMAIENLTNTVNEYEKAHNEKVKEMSRYNTLEAELKASVEQNEVQKTDIERLNALLTDCSATLKQRDDELSKANETLQKISIDFQEQNVAYNELKSLVDQEDVEFENVRGEMERLLVIVSEDQKAILTKEKLILSLQNQLKEKKEFIKSQTEGKTKKEIEEEYLKKIKEKEDDILNLQDALDITKSIMFEKDTQLKKIDAEMKMKDQELKTHLDVKNKCDELMEIVLKQKTESESLRNDAAANEIEMSKNEILQKEIFALKVTIQQKDQDILHLNNLLVKRKHAGTENIKIEALTKTDHHSQEEIDRIILNLQEKVVNEQLINEQSEEEIIQLRIELENVKKELDDFREKIGYSDYDQSNVLRLKDDEIVRLKRELLKEKKITAHVQVAQEKEIIEKEKEISILNQILEEERQYLSRGAGSDSQRELIENSPESSASAIESQTLVSEVTETVTFQGDLATDDEEDFTLVDDSIKGDNKLVISDLSLG